MYFLWCAFFFLTDLLVHNFKNWIFSIDFLLCFLIFNVTTFPPEWNGAAHFPTEKISISYFCVCIKIVTAWTCLLFPLTILSPNTEGDREALGNRAVSRHPGSNRDIGKLKTHNTMNYAAPRNVRMLSPGGKLRCGYWTPSTPTHTRWPPHPPPPTSPGSSSGAGSWQYYHFAVSQQSSSNGK